MNIGINGRCSKMQQFYTQKGGFMKLIVKESSCNPFCEIQGKKIFPEKYMKQDKRGYYYVFFMKTILSCSFNKEDALAYYNSVKLF